MLGLADAPRACPEGLRRVRQSDNLSHSPGSDGCGGLRSARWCLVVVVVIVVVVVVRVLREHHLISWPADVQFECHAKIGGQLFYGRSSSKRAAHHEALVEVAFLSTLSSMPVSCCALRRVECESGQGDD
jgi:hypothetical protein